MQIQNNSINQNPENLIEQSFQFEMNPCHEISETRSHNLGPQIVIELCRTVNDHPPVSPPLLVISSGISGPLFAQIHSGGCENRIRKVCTTM